MATVMTTPFIEIPLGHVTVFQFLFKTCQKLQSFVRSSSPQITLNSSSMIKMGYIEDVEGNDLVNIKPASA